MVETDAEAVMVEALHAPVDVGALEDGFVESLVKVRGNRCELGIPRLFGQLVGVVGQIEERIEVTETGIVEWLEESIDLCVGAVDGLFLRGIEGGETVGKTLTDIDDAVEVGGAQQFEVAVDSLALIMAVTFLPCGGGVIEHVGEGILHVALLDETSDKGRQYAVVAVEQMG